MAIEPIVADIILKLAGKLPNRRVLCLGYPDILTLDGPPPDPERQSIAKWHHWKGGIEHAEHFFGRQSLEADYWDIVKARGPEWVVDLNLPWHPEGWFPEPYALVIDPGTTEHIFNLGNVFTLLSQICVTGGYILHANPLGMGNHGFWSIHPTAYQDFYEANGFKIEMMAELSGPLDNRTVRPVPAAKRFNIAQDSVMICLAKKEQDVRLTWPMQSKYRNNPMLKGAA